MTVARIHLPKFTEPNVSAMSLEQCLAALPGHIQAQTTVREQARRCKSGSANWRALWARYDDFGNVIAALTDKLPFGIMMLKKGVKVV